MSEEIDLGGIKVSAKDWEATPESIKLVLMLLLEERKQMKLKIESLEERLNKNSRNSSIPPSKDGFVVKAKKKSPRKPLKIQASRQKPLQEHKIYEAEDCLELQIHEEKPSKCNACGYEVQGEDPEPTRHQIIDLPVLKPLVVEHRLHELECSHCGAKTRATLPLGLSAKCYGARLAAFVAFLSGGSRQSFRQTQMFLSQVLGMEISRGTINRMRQEVSEAVASAVDEAKTYVQQQDVINCDETGYRQQNKDGNNPDNKKAWIWVLVTPLVSVFMITLSRSQEIAQKLIGEGFTGYVGSDRYSSYAWLKEEQRQLCWSHLLRDFQAMAERTGVSKEIGESLLRRGYRLFHWWHRVRDGTMSRELFIKAVELLRTGLRQELEEAAAIEIGKQETTPLAKTVRTCRNLLKVEKALWTFVYLESLEPTNNSAERGLRFGVIWRDLTFGSQSAEGSRFVERMLTVNTSLKSQGRSILEFLTESCVARREGLKPPSLIPQSLNR
jgi:transposase